MREINNKNEGLINVLFGEKNYASGIFLQRSKQIIMNLRLPIFKIVTYDKQTYK